ncbi:MAG: sulfur oxidation c-type cytochrome SoxX, partial [Methylococcales bacterium]
KKIAFDRAKGNCLACHSIDDGEMPGNIGPPLIVMQARFPDRAVLKAQIWDATAKNSISIMPPFGKHHILTDGEIEKLLDYLYTL